MKNCLDYLTKFDETSKIIVWFTKFLSNELETNLFKLFQCHFRKRKKERNYLIKSFFRQNAMLHVNKYNIIFNDINLRTAVKN